MEDKYIRFCIYDYEIDNFGNKKQKGNCIPHRHYYITNAYSNGFFGVANLPMDQVLSTVPNFLLVNDHSKLLVPPIILHLPPVNVTYKMLFSIVI